jgi:hypothetical protein
MRAKILLIALGMTLLLAGSLIAENLLTNDGETYLKMSISSPKEINTLTRIVSIDNVIGNEVYAYANPTELEKLKALGYTFEVLPHPGTLIIPRMASTKEEMRQWDSYPTYDAYVDMMYQFETDYPDICRIENIGQTVQGRDLLFAVISDNVDNEEAEPEFMYTSTVHGDETTGYVLMLRLIDYLLTNYGEDDRITNMVDNMEIWINPLANPDGTYHGGNNTVWGAWRGNANGVDLNRNFPDPAEGQHPDGNPWQPETIAMMDLAEAHNFVHSANFHGGTEVVNYPWDTWEHLHADDEWYQVISHEYADTAQANSPPGYMSGFDDGITNGYQWYRITGGRQDYMNYFRGCREVTIEISDTKLLPESQLPAHWEYNWRSFLNYIENVMYGIRGIVTDEEGNPLEAKITILDHDFDNSEVFSDPDIGDYYRMLLPDRYDVEFSASGFLPQTIYNVRVNESGATILNIQLEPAQTITVYGTVLDVMSYEPIEGASVELMDTLYDPVTTDSTGQYTLSEVIEGRYTFRVSKDGYAPISKEILVTEEQNIVDFLLYPAVVESFETGEFSDEWTFAGNADWVIDNTISYDGVYSARSGNIGDNQTSAILTTIEMPQNGVVCFWKKVSSESGWDFLEFYVDGILQDSWSGEIGWSEEVFNLEAGTHTLKWSYEKDYAVSGGSDCAWIDYIIFPSTQIPQPRFPSPRNFYVEQEYESGHNHYYLFWDPPLPPPIEEHVGYNVYRNFEVIASLPQETLSFSEIDAPTMPGSDSIFYYVTALYENPEGESLPSDTVVCIPFMSAPDTPQPFVTQLGTNYPNPFSTSTTISFTIHPRDMENAEIEIYNIKGQLVKQFNPPAGGLEFKINEVVWDGTDQKGKQVSSGIYFYRLTADNFQSDVKKMIMLKE